MLSTRGKGTLAGAVAGACAICIAVCAQMAAPLPHSPEQAQAITAEEANGSTASGGSATRGGESARSDSERAHVAVGNASAALEEALGDESEGIPADTSKPEAEAYDSARQQGESTAGSSSGTADDAKRKWVIDYKDVWVEDVEEVIDIPEHTEPIYGTVDVLICNACGHTCEDGNEMGAHLSRHALEGVDEGYRSAPEQIQVGEKTVPATYKTIDHSHFEKVENGGHWE